MLQFSRRIRNRALREVSKLNILQYQAESAYQTALAEHISCLPCIASNDCPLVEALYQQGIYTTTLDELQLPLTAPLLAGVRSLLPRLRHTPPPHPKDFMVKVPTHQLLCHPALYHWGLAPRLLHIIENYFTLPVAYHGVYFRRDIANGLQHKTRLWHLDKEDRRMVKIIIYLRDVDEQTGPLQYIPVAFTPYVRQALQYDFGRVTDAVMERVISQSLWQSCVGLQGTVIVFDPARVFHRGQPPTQFDRFTLFFDYTSRQPRYPYYCKSDFSVNELLQLANSLSPEQLQCVFWNQKLLKHYQHWQSKTAVQA